MEILATIVFFGACMGAMSVGVLFSGRELKGSCGGVAGLDDLSCGVCERQAAELCPSEDELVRLAQLTHPNPIHHRG